MKHTVAVTHKKLNAMTDIVTLYLNTEGKVRYSYGIFLLRKCGFMGHVKKRKDSYSRTENKIKVNI
jgi:hypothetical protein